MNNALLVAFHFPPFAGSSGVQRTLSFVRHLPRHGWKPHVLTVDPRAYPQTSADQLGDIPVGTAVVRTRALDSARDLSLFGIHSRWLALPDRWWSWRFTGGAPGMRMVREIKPGVLWSTYPIATAHLLGARLHRRSRIPWIADFRDPMIEKDERTGKMHPGDPMLRAARAHVERVAARYASRLVFCTAGAREIFLERHREYPAEHAVLIENGFDEAIFAEVAGTRPPAAAQGGGPVVLLHSGIVYPGTDRDPTPLFKAIRALLDSQRLAPGALRVIFRGSGHDQVLAPLIDRFGLAEMVTLAGAIAYRKAIEEMLSAGALLVLQGYTSNPAIPAKLYEYLRAGRPIFGIVDPKGETARLLTRCGVGTMASPDSPDDIAAQLERLVGALLKGSTVPVLTHEQALAFSREQQAGRLAELFSSVAAAGSRSEVLR